jgi:hypothetical protein
MMFACRGVQKIKIATLEEASHMAVLCTAKDDPFSVRRSARFDATQVDFL